MYPHSFNSGKSMWLSWGSVLEGWDELYLAYQTSVFSENHPFCDSVKSSNRSIKRSEVGSWIFNIDQNLQGVAQQAQSEGRAQCPLLSLQQEEAVCDLWQVDRVFVVHWSQHIWDLQEEWEERQWAEEEVGKVKDSLGRKDSEMSGMKSKPLI